MSVCASPRRSRRLRQTRCTTQAASWASADHAKSRGPRANAAASAVSRGELLSKPRLKLLKRLFRKQSSRGVGSAEVAAPPTPVCPAVPRGPPSPQLMAPPPEANAAVAPTKSAPPKSGAAPLGGRPLSDGTPNTGPEEAARATSRAAQGALGSSCADAASSRVRQLACAAASLRAAACEAASRRASAARVASSSAASSAGDRPYLTFCARRSGAPQQQQRNPRQKNTRAMQCIKTAVKPMPTRSRSAAMFHGTTHNPGSVVGENRQTTTTEQEALTETRARRA
jgi:hypothetical protein